MRFKGHYCRGPELEDWRDKNLAQRIFPKSRRPGARMPLPTSVRLWRTWETREVGINRERFSYLIDKLLSSTFRPPAFSSAMRSIVLLSCGLGTEPDTLT